MRYITVYGKVTPHRVITKDKVYWLSHNSGLSGNGFFTLDKEYNNTYTIIRYLLTDEEFGE